MFSYSELNAVELSTTKKDYYQIWNELLEVAQKLSERWDPTATNEADPGIVLLKVATALADKINYAVDANTLEAFMPSCAQEASMRKLCDMLGYSMAYYRSATTDAKIICKKAIPVGQLIHIDKFSSLKDIDNKVNYLTLEEAVLSADTQSVVVPCIEGELIDCETDDNNIISLRHLDDNFRYYLPETSVAENGIFVTNLSNDGATASFGQESLPWQQVSNLNTVPYGTKVYKFGFDSRLKAPYLQFPDDVSSLIDDGLRIRFIRSRGANGNIAVNTLSKLEKPLSWSAAQSSADTAENPLTEILNNMENFAASNILAARNGRNPEGINSAYKNFQKTIGTFDTLVTCRDYMNKIYQMTSASSEGNHLVSNIIVSDIKDDINRAFTLTTLGDFGVETKSVSKTKVDPETNKAIDRITHFDLILYPFTALVGTNTKLDFENSFKYSNKAEYEILQQLEQNKLLSHNIIVPPAYSTNDLKHSAEDIACIKACFKLDAKITTTKKVMATECTEIEQIVHKALYTAFNMRQMTFGEELPYDEILHVMENADPRIKNVILDDPRISFKAVHLDGTELEILNSDGKTNADALSPEARDFNKLVLANVLAGRIALFNYDLNFETRFDEKVYPAGYLPPDADFFQESESEEGGNSGEGGEGTGSAGEVEPQVMSYPIFSSDALKGAEVSEVETELKLFPQRIKDLSGAQLVLGAGEVVQFRAPNFRTVTTYPAYINYYLQRNVTNPTITPAKMVRVLDWLRGSKTDSAKFYAKARVNNLVGLDDFEKSSAIDAIDSDNAGNYAWELVTEGKVPMSSINLAGTDPLCGYNVRNLDSITSKYGALFTKSVSGDEYTLALGNLAAGEYFYPELASTTLAAWTKALESYYADKHISSHQATLYKASSLTYAPGELVDASGIKYTAASNIEGSKPLTSYALPEVAAGQLQLGKKLELESIPANADYALKSGEYLFIDYESAENSSSTTTRRISKVYGQGTIIRPNFVLSASAQVNTLKKEKFNKDLTSGTSWTKASDGSPFDNGSAVLPTGLYTLSTQEQIEIREPVQVKIQSMGANIYWERKNEDMLTRAEDTLRGLKRAYFFPKGALSYTLQEGEYFYYTDTDKLDMAYYGCGTEIRRSTEAVDPFKSLDDASISAAEIDELGLTAAIPWRPLDTSKGNLTVIEYQYTKLVEGDTLKSVQVRPDDLNPALNYISNDPVKVETASIICGGTAQELAPILVDDLSWEMFTRLELDIGPTKTQTLRTVYNTVSQPVLIPRVTLLTDAEGINKLDYSPLTLDSASVDAIPLTLRASHTIRSLGDRADASRTNFLDPSKPIRDLVVKACQQETLQAPGGALLNLNNMLDKFTTVSFLDHYATEEDSEDSLPKAFTLHNIVPEDHYNLIALYYNPDPAAEALDSAFGDIVDGKAPDTRIQIALTEGVPEIFNLYTGHDTTGWWRDEALLIDIAGQEPPVEAIRSAIVDRTDEALTEETTQINYIYPDQVNSAKTPGLYDLTYHAYVSDFYKRDFKIETLNPVEVPEDAITCRVPIPTVTSEEIPLFSTEDATTMANNRELYAIIDPRNGKIEVKHASRGQNFVVNFALKSTGRALTTLGDSNILDLVKVVQHNLVPILKSGTTSTGGAIDVADSPYYNVQAEYTLDPDLYANLTLEDLSNDTLDLSQIQGLPIEVIIRDVPVVNIGLKISQVVEHKQYVLRPGLNLIKLVSSCDINFYARQGSLDTLLFGNPSAIPVDDSAAINPRLGYVGGLARALKDIRELDTGHQFFYNTPIDTSAGLDLNLLDASDGLTLPSNWFDANNVVNKFVVSKIDADYLANHVIVSKFSRR